VTTRLTHRRLEAQSELPLDHPMHPSRREDEAVYAAVVKLRRRGWKVYRGSSDAQQHMVNGTFWTRAKLIAVAVAISSEDHEEDLDFL
jgi:DNA polymerase IIIc chi subunit